MTRTGLKPIHSSKLVGRMVNGVPKGTKSYIAAKTAELKEEKAKKKVITLDSDKLHSMLFDVEWDLAEKTQSLIAVLKTANKTMICFKKEKPYCFGENSTRPNSKSLIEALENLLEKRMNVLSAQCIIYDEEEK
tara:strand:- start:84 stop:485 length:402 start_codon:yes stop_codon:yes gene_type:complete